MQKHANATSRAPGWHKKHYITTIIDFILFLGLSSIGLLNLIFFFVHLSLANLTGIFTGRASLSFTFMAASALVLSTMSIFVAYLALRRKSALERLRNMLAWRIIRIVLSAFAVLFMIVESMMIAASFPKDAPMPPDTIIILGAHVAADGLSATLQSRLEAGLAYAAANPGAAIIVSGGQGLDEPISEAAAMRGFLVANGIDEGRIWMEDESHNTFENLVFTMDILNDKGRFDADDGIPDSSRSYSVTIVTSEFHIFRTAMLAGRVGYDPHFISAPTPFSILPSCYSREFFGVVKSFFVDR